MRITLPSGVIIESTDEGEVERLARLILNGTGAPPPPPKKTHHKKVTPAVETEKLSPQLAETWTWMVAHDTPAGINVHQVAEGLHITVHAATFRLNGLIGKGLARRLRRGWYRPGEAPQQAVPTPQVVSIPDAPAASEEHAEPSE